MNLNEVQSTDYDILENIKVAFNRLWKAKVIVLLASVIGFLMTFVYIGIIGIHTTYYASASIYSAVYGSDEESLSGVALMNTYVSILGTPRVCDRAADSLRDYGIDSMTLMGMVRSGQIYMSGSSTSSKNYGYRLVLVSRMPSSDRITEITNAMAQAYATEINGLRGSSSLQVLDDARGYSIVKSLNPKKYMIVFTLAAFVLACVIIFMKEFFSSKVYSVAQCEQDKDKILGILPYCK